MEPLLSHPSQRLNRRRFMRTGLAAVVGGCAAGSAVGTFAVRSQPRLLVVGDHGWQVGLLLTSRTRVLILIGELKPDAISSIPMLLSAMRQRIDVVMGTAASVGLLAPDFHERWLVRRTLILPHRAETAVPTSASDQTLYLPGDVRLTLSTSPRGYWLQSSADMDPTWANAITISRGRIVIAIARDLETIANLAPLSTAVAIAPAGNIEHLTRHLAAVPAICINADSARDQDVVPAGAGDTTQVTRSLVRIFHSDVAEFRLSHNGVTIPRWRQPML